jgi:hypothetical protein
LKDIPVRIDGKLEIVVFNRAPDRLAVKIDDYGGSGTVEDLRWIGLDAGGIRHLWHDLAALETSQHSVERDHFVTVGNCRLQLGYQSARLVARQRGEVEFSDLERLEIDQAFVDGNLSV